MSLNKLKTISILGSTGSIGTQTLDVVRNHPDMFKVESLSVNTNIDILIEQIKEFNPKTVVVYNEKSFEQLTKLKKQENITCLKSIEILKGMDGLIKISSSKTIDILVTAVVGMIGLLPTMEAIKNSTTIALANKETLVTAGKLVMEAAIKYNAKILPVDSEHSAIFQCLNGENYKEIDKILLTASGGPFRGKSKGDLLNATKDSALKHPKWNMGKKISIDSSTLMNKGLEVIEAKWLFGVEADDIIVHVHPESLIHSMVQFKDSSIIAQIGCPDMRVPIQYAMTYPNRIESNFKRLDLFEISSLHFEKPDLEVFPCLKLAYKALKHGGTDCAVLNAANEVLVEKFLEDRIGFYDIPKFIEYALNEHTFIENPNLQEILEVDSWTRDYIEKIVK
ncbi:1-deoxy-D-xylulose-5-phosphate reductoisomerase [Peptostreptococcus equinus]|uniref:1-deoxy-D-xylulose 5-phosphate reductoisomerase n=1 Tax=Peptostreptococcus equinus TaxID=3003601 RepID=A0ABY7JQQ3_9FIRM|nr:1-deoxy-D-xylulose-5-phosphate reductoisomerase [Peptostreptococcus sp. CBA3647]WAW15688.1 1-deoxy-D-xylulose-5-phosphate reductoisomerase [Peptostreptococcus sp. CBA3647]